MVHAMWRPGDGRRTLDPMHDMWWRSTRKMYMLSVSKILQGLLLLRRREDKKNYGPQKG